MKKRSVKVISAALAGVMTLSLLTGCGKDNSGSSAGGNTSGGGSTAPVDEYVYTASFKKVKFDGIDNINSIIYADGAYYIQATNIIGTEEVSYGDGGSIGILKDAVSESMIAAPAPGPDGGTYTQNIYGTVFYRLDSLDSTPVELTGYKSIEKLEDAGESYSYINGFSVTNGRIITMETVSATYFNLPDDFDETTDNKWEYYDHDVNTTYLNWFNTDGSDSGIICVNDLWTGDDTYLYFNYFRTDNAGNCYLANDTGIIVINPEGKEIFTCNDFSSAFNWLNNLAVMKDGRVYAVGYTTDGENCAALIDAEASALAEPVVIDSNAWSTYPGSNDYDFYFTNGTNLCGYNMDKDETTTLFNWINCNIDSDDINCIIPRDDGSFEVLTSSWDDNSGERIYEIATVNHVLSSTLPETVNLTLATLYLDWETRKQILSFNKTNGRVHITVKDYSEYDTEDDWSAGLTKLTTEILAGNVPDLMTTNDLPMNHFAAKGLLENLWTYIDNDTELGGRDALVKPFFDALCASDGNLYQISPSFQIVTCMGMGKATGTTTAAGWTVNDLKTAMQNMPANAKIFESGATKVDVLNMICYMCLNQLVDWNTGKCSFDSTEFIEMLEFANMFPLEFNWEDYYNDESAWQEEYAEDRFITGKQLLNNGSIYSITDMAYEDGLMGGDLEFVGFPSASGNGSAFSYNGGIAMSSKCSDKDAAWEFMRTFLQEEYQSNTYGYWSIPSNVSALNKVIENATTIHYYENEKGEKVPEAIYTFTGPDGKEVEVYNVSDELIAKFQKVLNTTVSVYEYDEALTQIVTDEATAYFNGQKSVQDAAKLIQSRVNIYINEQK